METEDIGGTSREAESSIAVHPRDAYLKIGLEPSRAKTMEQIPLPIDRAVLKIGGSILFSDSKRLAAVERFIDRMESAQILIIVGGGDVVEGMRSLHSYHPSLDDELVHWRCIELLDASWEAASALLPLDGRLPDWNSVIDACASSSSERWAKWVRVGGYYNREYHQSLPLNCRPAVNWSTTTDALAWVLGYRCQATEVVLLKSCHIEESESLELLSIRGAIDSEISRLANTSLGPRCRVLPLEFDGR